MVETLGDPREDALTDALRQKRQVETFMRDPIWLSLKATLELELERNRRSYEQAGGRNIDQLVQNEASRGAISAVRSILEFPQNLLEEADNMIQAIRQLEENENELPE